MLCTVLCIAAGSFTQAGAEPVFVRNGEAGFVISNIRYALEDAEVAGGCPAGMNAAYQNPQDYYLNFPTGIKQKAGESEDDFRRRFFGLLRNTPDLKSVCMHPELTSPPADFRTVTGDNVKAFGIDLDGHNSAGDAQVRPGSCPHNDFVGMNGEPGVDNQYFRVLGCTPGYQSIGQGNSFNTAGLSGSWGILVKLNDVDDIHNDDHVDVGIFANRDPIRLSASREPLRYGTYTIRPELRFQARTTGKIVDGVFTTEPVDVRINYDVNAMYVDRALLDAQLQLTLSEEGVMEGYLAGYAPVEEQYDLDVGFRDGRIDAGVNAELSPFQRRQRSAIGKAGAMNYTCPGMYHAMYEFADGHPDPETGKCTSISTQYQITAIPAFILEEE